jgi:hypothetical protein
MSDRSDVRALDECQVRVVEDLERFAIKRVYKKGILVAEDGKYLGRSSRAVEEPRNTMNLQYSGDAAFKVKANGAKMQFGSAGAGSATHMTCVLLNSAIGIDVTHVPYRGTGPAMQVASAASMKRRVSVCHGGIGTRQCGYVERAISRDVLPIGVAPADPVRRGRTSTRVEGWPLPGTASRHGPRRAAQGWTIFDHRGRLAPTCPRRVEAAGPGAVTPHTSGAVAISPSVPEAMARMRPPSEAETIIMSPSAKHIGGISEEIRLLHLIEPHLSGFVVPQREAVGVGEHGQIADGEGHGSGSLWAKRKGRRGCGSP